MPSGTLQLGGCNFANLCVRHHVHSSINIPPVLNIVISAILNARASFASRPSHGICPDPFVTGGVMQCSADHLIKLCADKCAAARFPRLSAHRPCGLILSFGSSFLKVVSANDCASTTFVSVSTVLCSQPNAVSHTLVLCNHTSVKAAKHRHTLCFLCHSI